MCREMKLLSLTLAAVLCAVLLQQTTGAVPRKTKEQRLWASTLNQMYGQLKGNSPVQPKTHSASYASAYNCYQCVTVKADGVYSDGSECDLTPELVKTVVNCGSSAAQSCQKLVTTENGNGHTIRMVKRDCATGCVNGTLSGTVEKDGKTADVTIIESCCTGEKCNGSPSVNYTSKIFVSSIGLLLTIFYSY